MEVDSEYSIRSNYIENWRVVCITANQQVRTFTNVKTYPAIALTIISIHILILIINI